MKDVGNCEKKLGMRKVKLIVINILKFEVKKKE